MIELLITGMAIWIAIIIFFVVLGGLGALISLLVNWMTGWPRKISR